MRSILLELCFCVALLVIVTSVVLAVVHKDLSLLIFIVGSLFMDVVVTSHKS